MEEPLSLIQRARNSIALGESHFREFKTALEGKPGNKHPRRTASICSEVGEALVAFANADGGELFIGVEDNGVVTGLQHTPEEIETMQNAVKTHIFDSEGLPLQQNCSITIDGKQILFFSVTKSIDKIFQLPDGRCMRRQDKSSMPATFEKIEFERRELASREYDRAFVDGAAVNDLDLQLVQQIADGLLKGMSPEQYLQQVNLAEYGLAGLRLKRAALLLFAKDITKWYPRCQVRILRVDGDEIRPGEQYNVISDDFVTGNIFFLLVNAWERLRPFLSQRTVFGTDAKFEQTFVYPETACREALVNAIAHRDYSVNNPITIYVYKNKLVFESPGELLSTISIELLREGKGIHESRNSNIARVLRENKYMRELGEGIRRIFELMQAHELAAPQIESAQNAFRISMTHQSIYTERELMWFGLFKDFDLDQAQKRIVMAGIDGRMLSQTAIYTALGCDDRNLYDRSVTTLRVSGILQEINKNTYAARMARETGQKKQDIVRFVIVSPDKIKVENTTNKVYIYNLPQTVDASIVKKSMIIFGDVQEVDIPKSDDTKQQRGFAYVTYSTQESALKAVAIRNIRIGDNVVGILPYKPKNKRHFQSKKRVK